MGVLARGPWHVDGLPCVSDQPWVLPVLVLGPIDFTVLAVWALGTKYTPGRLSYAGQTTQVINELLPIGRRASDCRRRFECPD